jgi:hypothetical protein
MFEAIWSDIAADPLEYGVVQRRLRSDVPHDVFLAEDRPQRDRYLVMSIVGPVGSSWRHLKRTRGIEIDVVLETATTSRVRIHECDRRKHDLFDMLVADLVSRIDRDITHSSLDRLTERLLAWQSFFETSTDGMSEESQVGLFAELHVLHTIMMGRLDTMAAVVAWHGPDPALQDFQVADLAIEVKATRATGPTTVLISSERQLDTTGLRRLFLLVTRVDAREAGAGQTLPDIVHNLRLTLNDHLVALELFDASLLKAGYADLHAPRYTTRYSLRQMEAYEVGEGFPRIQEDALPTGVGSVRYRLQLSACADWQVDLDDVHAALSGRLSE